MTPIQQQVATPRRAIKVALLDAEMTQRQLAKRTRINASHLSRIINGERVASPTQKGRIARVLAKPVEELFGDVA